MLKKITRVKNFRCFQEWKAETTAIEFEALNLVYAPNGTGKSTLAALLSEGTQDPEWGHGMRAEVLRADDSRDVIEAPDSFWEDIRVFSADYVRANLRFDAESQGATPLLYLGEENIEMQERRRNAKHRISKIEAEVKQAQKSQRREENSRDRILSECAKSIREELGAVNARFSGHRFDKRTVSKALEDGLTPKPELDAAAEIDRSLIAGPARERLEHPPEARFVPGDLISESADLLSRTVLTDALAELQDDPQAANWVQHGLEMHRERPDCLMCGSVITSERIGRLDRHFDDSLRRLQEQIDAALSRLTDTTQKSTTTLQQLPRKSDVYPELQERYERAFKNLECHHKEIVSHLGNLRSALENKKDTPFSSSSFPGDRHLGIELDLREIKEVIGEHNRRTDEFRERRDAAAHRQAHRLIQRITSELSHANQRIAEINQTVSTLKNEQQAHENVLTESYDDGLDPHFFLSQLNADIARLLGRSDLSFNYDDGHYVVTRAGRAAHHLSEGEKTAIALLYFLQSLTERGRRLEDSIIVVDDPVSSLDEDLMRGVFSHLLTRLDPSVGEDREDINQCRQLFVLTHNHTFFRMWHKEAQRTLGPRTPNREKSRKKRFATVHMMRSVDTQDRNEIPTRTPRIRPIDLSGPESQTLISEYYQLFWTAARELAEARSSQSVSKDYELTVALPNMARRLLEHFLEFRQPGSTEKFSEAVENLDIDPVVRRRVVKFLHDHSHGTPGTWSQPVPRGEIAIVVASVFGLMRSLDLEHFDGMCSRLGLVPQEITVGG